MKVGPYQLRPRQVETIDNLRKKILEGFMRILLVAPCGFGKTMVIAAIASMLKPGHRMLMVTSGRKLVEQCSIKLAECQMSHSILMADALKEIPKEHHEFIWYYSDKMPDSLKHVQKIVLVSKETYDSYLSKGKLDEFNVDLIVEDECHMHLSDSWENVRNCARVVIGLSATPATGKGRALPGWQTMVVGATYSELIGDGHLVDFEYVLPEVVDMQGVSVNRYGEYSERQAESKMIAAIGSAVPTYREHAYGLPCITFAQSVAHSMRLCQEFNDHGIPACHIDGSTPHDERKDYFDGMESGKYLVLCNYAVAGVGVDLPFVRVIQLQRAMNSLVNFIQYAGRGLRSFPGKENCLLIDHCGNVLRHGLPSADRTWTLRDNEPIRVYDRKGREVKDAEDFEEVKKLTTSGLSIVVDGKLAKASQADIDRLLGRKKKAKGKEKSKGGRKGWIGCLISCASSMKRKTGKDARELYEQRYGRKPTSFDMKPYCADDVVVREKFPSFDKCKVR